ncbi:hypothetical protein ON010_g5000 [Phytophthora cinnamomi]|nr:hypothetical protein ON010_g5000 [Phytophthora cinnamomi]
MQLCAPAGGDIIHSQALKIVVLAVYCNEVIGFDRGTETRIKDDDDNDEDRQNKYTQERKINGAGLPSTSWDLLAEKVLQCSAAAPNPVVWQSSTVAYLELCPRVSVQILKLIGCIMRRRVLAEVLPPIVVIGIGFDVSAAHDDSIPVANQ